MKFAAPGLLSVLLSLACTPASAATVFSFDSLDETKSVEAPLSGAVRLNGGLVGAGAIDNSFEFVATSTSMSLAAGWPILPTEVRTVGVNVDLLDQSSVVIATDTFGGLTGSQANSTLTASGLNVGATYVLKLTGTAVTNGRYVIDMVDGASPPPAPLVPPTVPSPGAAKFDTLVGAKIRSSSLAAGEPVAIDGDIFGAGSLTNAFSVTVTGTELSAGIGWLVTQNGSRTVGVNVDLLDSLNNVVATDLFQGLTGSQAFSQLSATGLTPGASYRLLLTGNVIRDGRYLIDLLADDTAPGFRPIDAVAAVPLPAGAGLLVAGMLMLGWAGRGLAGGGLG